MNKFILLIFLYTMNCIISYAYSTKDFEKYIKKLDVYSYVKDTSRADPFFFWYNIAKNNKPLNDYNNALDKRKGLALNVQKEVREISFHDYNSFNHLPSVQNDTDTLERMIGLHELPGFDIYFIDDDDLNAYAYPSGQICLTITLLKALDFDPLKILGVCAHETAHFYLSHTEVEKYQTAKRLRRNEIAAAIVASINIAANGYAQAQGLPTSQRSKDESWNIVNQANTNLVNGAINDAVYKFKPSYSREQEIEADIIATRFLEWLGLSASGYIDVLKILKENESTEYSSLDEHPRMDFRIELLEYMLSKKTNKEE